MDKQPEFDKPTNEWIDEDIEVKVVSPVFNEKTHTVTLKEETKTVKQKTYYADSTPAMIVCKEHVYLCVNKGKYHFKCTKCDWNRIAPPVSFKFDESTGILTRRASGVRV